MKRVLKRTYANRYPWEEWFRIAAKRELTLTRGEEFPITNHPHGMMQMVRKAAYRLGHHVKVSIGETWVTVRVVGSRTPNQSLPLELSKGRGRPKREKEGANR